VEAAQPLPLGSCGVSLLHPPCCAMRCLVLQLMPGPGGLWVSWALSPVCARHSPKTITALTRCDLGVAGLLLFCACSYVAPSFYIWST
jgi:hypothetical protein